MLDIEKIETCLKKSKFRSRFKLNQEDIAYIKRIGLSKLQSHADDFIIKKLVPAKPENDGKQTPFKGHPVFKAQHATATCCRGCLWKWYGIAKKRPLEKSEINFVKQRIVSWIKSNLKK